jgi:nitrile hydratase
MPHDHQHSHDESDSSNLPSDPALRVKALESLLVEKGLIDPAALDAIVDTYEHKIGPRNGAKVVARAWTDPEFKRRLLADATAAIGEMGYLGRQGEHMVVVENTGRVYPVFLLPVAGLGAAAGLVQVGRISITGSDRTARRVARVRRRYRR